MNLFEIVLQIVIPPKEDELILGINTWTSVGIRGQMMARNKHFPDANNNLSKSDWISYTFYYKVPCHKRKAGIDFYGMWLEPIKYEGPQRGQKQVFVF